MSDDVDRSARLRDFFASYIAARGRASDPRIREAFAAVRREHYAGAGPWSIAVPGHGAIATQDDDPAYLYQDTLVVIDAARGINIGEPSLHARCLDAVSPMPGETVLHVGAGVGYYTAILAQLVGPEGRVHALEIEPDLAARAGRNLAHLPHVAVEARSGLADDLPQADIVYVSAGLPLIPPVWLDALAPGGRLVFPFQSVGSFGAMLKVNRPRADGVSWPARIVTPAGFVGCAGGQDHHASQRLAAAVKSAGWHVVRSLRRDTPPDHSCWLVGDGWWLSTSDPDE